MSNANTISNDMGLDQVNAFWDTEACGTHFVQDYSDDRDFFTRYREFRYRTEWHIPGFASFADANGKELLEIGCGNGCEGVMFARHGASYTGVDLTREAIDATRRHFSVEGLDGRFQQENAEQLSFADNSYDIVYSFGVLHHTPSPSQAISEVHRVLKPGGVARIMLYYRNSFNYGVRILVYMRARILLKILSRTGNWASDRAQYAGQGQRGLRGNESPAVWDLHYRAFLRQGWRYLRADNIVHHCTDGPECPIAYVYSKREARELFRQFSCVTMSVGHLPLNKYPVVRLLPAVERLVSRLFGWHLLITATK